MKTEQFLLGKLFEAKCVNDLFRAIAEGRCLIDIDAAQEDMNGDDKEI